MKVFKSGNLINEIQRRTKQRVEMLELRRKRDQSTIHRIEKEAQNPGDDTLELMMNEMEVPMEGFYYPLLEDQPMDVLILRDYLVQSLELNDLTRAEKLLAQIESRKGFTRADAAINYQFILPFIRGGCGRMYANYQRGNFTARKPYSRKRKCYLP